jgi:DnaJ-domain-containing protein 1
MMNQEDYIRQNRAPVAVLVTLTSGASMRGSILVSRTKTISEELNKGEPFIEFETQEGDRMFLARSVIGTVRETNMPKVDSLANKVGQMEKADPHEVLHLPKDASAAEIRQAYLQLAKTYHPDRFTKVELPREV